MSQYIYIYIYRERERERETQTHTYIHTVLFSKREGSRTHSDPKFHQMGLVILIPGKRGSRMPFQVASFREKT
jgi:hypothetical protein